MTDQSAAAVDVAHLKDYSRAFNADRANLVAANAAVSTGVLAAATDYRGLRSLPRDFSIELKQGSITNQERSGRCWMFASLNTLRYELMHRWNLEDFEFSETYLFFWDAIEKSNTYLEHVLDTLDEPTDSRIFEVINDGPSDDGGWWQMFAALVNKYGLVPKSAYPESANSRDSDAFKQYLNTKLREFAAGLRRSHEAGASTETLRETKREDMATVYRICAIALGEPPATFDFLARVKDDDDKDDAKNDGAKAANDAKGDGKDYGSKAADTKAKPESGKDERRQIRETGITPLEFYRKYVPVDVNDFVTISNAPMKRTPFGKRYRILYTANVIEAGDMEFVNVPLDVFKKAAIDQLSAGHPIWFACDCMQFSLRGEGVFDCDTVRVDQLFGTEFTFDKADGLEYGDSPSNHAMTFTGVNLDADGRPDRWKIENSWGKDNGKDGYYVASDAWFDQYVTELIIRKDMLDQATLDLTKAEPVELEPWQPLTRRCR
ncbi:MULTISPECIES: aminopeptidase C [Bifidobacterium]|uniref:Aminopeptidase n=1 Tax=Bifidobacterium reuteri DSM 23975 TaxID=1437610 RepID=A0A087CNZ0_9BIFI|nr:MULTISPECIES: C1 family peptidase [Bifidobacterium]KFI84990.1 putative aminopeptidase C [Bifidobacterium reuteri DSM 23975]TPF77397.1 aminopeptidase [Bifidobacterium sp. UTCIF-1]TPF79420.1 aminopeptidase [Bifidobacterium sp. UTCIF-24]TPF81401.1 aminopeptidase [Bifidobacterium sp. UTCIF-3]TPF83493.1 aminopeptidase [Bifidobacterium sp. UTCIF-36]